MSEKSFRFTKRSTVNKSNTLNKPQGYRMIYKTKSGFLQTQSISQSRLIKNNKMNVTQTSFCTQRQQSSKQIGSIMRGSTTKFNFQFNQSMGEDREQNIEHTPLLESSSIQPMTDGIEEQNLSQLSIGQVQQKIDDLIQMKLQKAAERTTEQNKEPDQIDCKINKIVDYLQREQTGPENLKLTNRKIQILQKIMAKNIIESQLAKKYYFKQLSNRKTKITKASKYQAKTNLSELKQKTRRLMSRNPPTSIHFQSTCQINYRAPAKDAYPQLKMKAKYVFDNQPLPRSSYGRDYLAYGSLPKYKHKEQNIRMLPACSIGKRNSSYNDEFTIKKIEKINFKQLDCYQDKFKNLKIPFLDSKSYRVEHSPENRKCCTIQNPQAKRKQRHKSEVQESHFIDLLATENRVKYRGEENEIKSGIKDKKLNNYKYAYKAVVHA